MAFLMIKKILFFSILTLLMLDHTEGASLLILNMLNEEALPRNFRTCQSPIRSHVPMPSLEGLENLHLSGSGQFSLLSWNSIKKSIQYSGAFFDVDLRQETHGFVNGAAISLYSPRNWGNCNKSYQQISLEESSWLNKLATQKTLTVQVIKKKNRRNH